MAIGGDVAVDEESVTGGESGGERMSIRRYVDIGELGIFLGPAMQAETRQRWFAIHIRKISEDFVEGAVLANDEEDMLQAGRWRAGH